MTLVLGLDIGSTTTKAALVEVTDAVTVLRVVRRPTPTDVDGLLETVAATARECLAAASSAPAAVGIASMAESGAVLGRDGRALTPLLRWNRRVDPAHLERLLADHPTLPLVTGIPPTTKPAAVALAALRTEQPDTLRAMRHWAGVADLVGHALTGIRATDHTLAARTMLAGRGDGWDADLIESLGVSVDVLPALRAPGEPVGPTTSVALRFGLSAGIPVHIAGHDHAVGAWAAGVRAPGATADSLGTSEAIVRVTDAAEGSIDEDAAIAEGFTIGRTVDGDARTILGGSPACGAMLAWWDAEQPGDRVRERLAALTADAWTTSPVIVAPYPSGRQCPAPNPTARVRIVGDGSSDERARGLLQSLVAQARWMRETADRLAGSPTLLLTVIGSLSGRIPVWAPLAAPPDVPTRRSGADEPVAAGAALLAAARTGVAESDSCVLPCDEVIPVRDPARDDTHRRFLTAIRPTTPQGAQ